MIKVANNDVDLQRGIDHIGISVSFVIHDGEGNIMLHKRGAKARDEQGCWDIGGGAIEFSESINEAIVREIKEEFCVDPIEIKFLTAYDAHRTLNDVPTHWVALVHTVQVDRSKVKNGEPHKIDEIGWFTSSDLPSPLHSQFWKSYQVALDQEVVK
ncbi:MAG: NUDIX domain-containing protein [Candidatus Saccharimonadales bacterium]